MRDRTCDIQFTKSGAIHDPAQVEQLLTECNDATSLLVLTHGWNNDMKDARRLYQDFLASLDSVGISEPEILTNMAVLQVFWPSKKFASEHLIAGGGAAGLSETDELHESLEALNHDPTLLGDEDSEASGPVWSNDIRRAQELAVELEDSEQARREFVLHIRAALNPAEADDDDASREFFELDPETLFTQFSEPVNYLPQVPEGGAAGGIGLTDLDEAGGAAFVGNVISGFKAAALRIANYATYYQMKSRAGAVGRNGLAQALDRLRERHPSLPIHLVGHSFGARAIVAAVAQLAPDGAPVSMSLLQAAFSHNGFAEQFDGTRDGAFRTVVKDQRATGPIIITHTKNDRAVGIAYPLASRIAKDMTAALGDENDPYGGMGRNGAQHTPEVNSTEAFLRALGAGDYQFSPGFIYNLLADEFIPDHSEVTGKQVANATLQAIRSALTT